MIYDWLTKIDSFNFRNKSIVIAGSGDISKEYCEVFEAFGIKDVSIIGRTKNKVARRIAKLVRANGAKPR